MPFDVKEEVRKIFGGHNWRHWRGPIEDLVNRAIKATEEQCIKDACPQCRLGDEPYHKNPNWYHRARERGPGLNHAGYRCLASDIRQLIWHRKRTAAHA